MEIAASRIGTITNLNDINPIFRRDDAGEGVLHKQGAVIPRDDLKTLTVENGHIRIEECQSKPNGLDLYREPLAFGDLDLIVVDILILGDAVHGDILLNQLRSLKVIVRFRLRYCGKLSHPEGAQLGDATAAPQSQPLLAQRTILGNGHGDGDFLGVFDIDCGNG